jgi:hypothetical protein
MGGNNDVPIDRLIGCARSRSSCITNYALLGCMETPCVPDVAGSQCKTGRKSILGRFVYKTEEAALALETEGEAVLVSD